MISLLSENVYQANRDLVQIFVQTGLTAEQIEILVQKLFREQIAKFGNELTLEDNSKTIINQDEWVLKFRDLISESNNNDFVNLIQSGSFKERKDKLRQVIGSTEINLSAYHFELANIFELEFDYKEAITHYKFATELDSTNFSYRRKYGLCLEVSGKYDDALHQFSIAQSNGLGNQDIQKKSNYDFGKIFTRKGESEKAKIYLTKYVEENKNDADFDLAEVYTCLGIVGRDTKNYLDALTNYNNALTIYKDLGMSECVIETYANMGTAYHYDQKFDESEVCYEFAKTFITENNKNSLGVSELYNNIASLYFHRAEYISAKEFYEKFRQVLLNYFDENHPRVAERDNNLAVAYYYLKDYENAKYFAKKSIAIGEKTYVNSNPKKAIRYNTMALVMRADKDYENALNYFQKAIILLKDKYNGEIPEHYKKIETNYLDTIKLLKADKE